MFNLHVRKTEKQTKREKKVKSGVEWRGRGRPKETWRRTFCKDLARVDIITW